jgi:cellulose synthase/poly-beta-1,6-N-acetylglucosamine synthase-like glycosyltransferase
MIMADLVFWASLCALSYVFVGYALILMLFGRLIREHPVLKGSIQPNVSLIISAYNEEKIIGEKIENSLSLDYPRDKLEIIVVSDCSTDQTDSIVKSHAKDGLILKRMAARSGKTAGLNDAVVTAKGDIIVFSDANALYSRDAIQKLVRNFSDPTVGCVTGDSRYVAVGDSSAGRTEDRYWGYERFLKIRETQTGSMVGSDGAVMAVRKRIFLPLRVEDISDFVTPLQIVCMGYRCVFEPEAVCYESTVSHFAQEFRRKVRVVNRSWNGLFRVKSLLNPLRYGWFSVQIVSHKPMRWLTPLFLICLFVSSFFLSVQAAIFIVAGQLIFYSSGVVGLLLDWYGIRCRWLSFPGYFLMINAASVVGAVKSLLGQKTDVWEPEREWPIQNNGKSRQVASTSL